MANQFWYTRNGVRGGPVDSAALKEMVSSGQLLGDDMLLKPGMANGVRVDSVPDLQMLVVKLPPPLPAVSVERGAADAADAEKSRKSGQSDATGLGGWDPFIGSRIVGALIMLVGLGLMLFGVFSEKTVGSYGERTYNIGLLTESTNLVIFGAAIFLAGVIQLGVARLLQLLLPRNGE